jgi:hypothetical protein
MGTLRFWIEPFGGMKGCTPINDPTRMREKPVPHSDRKPKARNTLWHAIGRFRMPFAASVFFALSDWELRLIAMDQALVKVRELFENTDKANGTHIRKPFKNKHQIGFLPIIPPKLTQR